MNNVKFKYEVAFSFLKEDENLANQINDLIQDRINTFLYSKRQEDIAGTDGEKTFSDVFGKQSRCVVVIYRKKWGTTSWTRIEEIAIRNRAFEEGYDFSLFIPLDKPPEVPKYLPKAQMWIGIERWGIKGAAAIIEAKIHSLGGESREELPTDIAARIKRDEQFESERVKLLHSVNGLTAASDELKKLFLELENSKNTIEKDNEGFSLDYNCKDRNCLIHYSGLSIRFNWQTAYRDTLIDSMLYFSLQRPKPSFEEPEILLRKRYHFDINKSGEYGWIKEIDRDSFISSKKLAEDSTKLLLLQADKERKAKKSDRYL